MIEVVPIPVLNDNYSYLVIDPVTREAAVVDCAETEPLLAEAERRGVTLTSILATHHHWDHVAGNEALSATVRLRVYGYGKGRARIPGLTDCLDDGESFTIGSVTGRTILIPAHTSDHVAYYFGDAGVVFTGDTLFVSGCGRLFEGDAAQMMTSLTKLADLPDDTRVYCGHEYTEQNLRFAATLEPKNKDLQKKLEAVLKLRAAGKPTVPTTVGSEKKTNPFLRWGSPELQASLRAMFPDLPADPVSVLARTRELKDRF